MLASTMDSLVRNRMAGSQVRLTAAALTATLFTANTMAAVFLPIAADLAEARRRGRTTGTVSFFNRVGGLTGPLLISLIVSSVTDVLAAATFLIPDRAARSPGTPATATTR
jgi:hypothetical protein